MLLLRLSGAVFGVALVLACAGSTPEPAVPVPAAIATPTPPVAAVPAVSAAPERALYYDRVITSADLDGRPLRELSLLRNTIFARVGNPFVKPWLNDYFLAQPWYVPGQTQDLSRLTEVDRQNVTILAAYERAVPRVVLLAQRSALLDRGATSKEDKIELRLLSEALGEWSGGDTVAVADRNPLEDPSLLGAQLSVDQIVVNYACCGTASMPGTGGRSSHWLSSSTSRKNHGIRLIMRSPRRCSPRWTNATSSWCRAWKIDSAAR